MLLNNTDTTNEARIERYRRKLARVARHPLPPEASLLPAGDEINYDTLTAGVNEQIIAEWWLRQRQTITRYTQRVAKGHEYQTRRIQ